MLKIYFQNFCHSIGRLRFEIIAHALSWGIVLLLVSPSAAYDFDDVISAFERDSKRTSPLRMVERYQTVIKQISHMKVRDDVKITVKARGVARQEFFDSIMEESYENPESYIDSYEFFLKRLHLVEKDFGLYDFLLESVYSDVSGMYLPKKKELLILKDANTRIMSATLIHELIHAAQDSVVDLDDLYETHANSVDGNLALKCLIEGQAIAIETLIRANQSIEDRSAEEVMKEVAQLVSKRMEENSFDSVLESTQLFPYTAGYNFVATQYSKGGKKDFRSMYNRIPTSTEQILHYDKFVRNEMPKVTILEEQKRVMNTLWKELDSTTLGEFYIQAIFNTLLKDSLALNKQAASGWGGDRINVFEANGRKFFVWDTLWDSKADANEFYKRYEMFSKMRFGNSKFTQTKTFNIVYPQKEPHLLIRKEGLRVLIIEGDVTEEIIRQALQNLN